MNKKVFESKTRRSVRGFRIPGKSRGGSSKNLHNKDLRRWERLLGRKKEKGGGILNICDKLTVSENQGVKKGKRQNS